MVKTMERTTVKERAEQLHVQDSRSIEGREDNAEHHGNKEENVGETDHISKQNAIDIKKRKHTSCIDVNETISTVNRPRKSGSIPKKNRSQKKTTMK